MVEHIVNRWYEREGCAEIPITDSWRYQIKDNIFWVQIAPQEPWIECPIAHMQHTPSPLALRDLSISEESLRRLAETLERVLRGAPTRLSS